MEKSSVTAGRGEVSVDSLIQVEEIDITAEGWLSPEEKELMKR